MLRVYWEMQSFAEPTTGRIMADLQLAESRSLISNAFYDKWKHPKVDPDPGVTWRQSIEEIDMPSGVSGRTLGKRTCSVYTTSDGKRFIFPENMDFDKEGMTPKRAIRLYDEVPASVRNKMQNAIYFVDCENPQDSYWRKRYKKFTKSYATGGQEITFYSHACHNDDYVIRTYCHEAGHYIDGLTAIYRDRYSDEKSWVEAMVRDCVVSGKSNPTAYAKNSKAEDFAESMAEYCVNKVQFEAEYPNRAAILNAILGW